MKTAFKNIIIYLAFALCIICVIAPNIFAKYVLNNNGTFATITFADPNRIATDIFDIKEPPFTSESLWGAGENGNQADFNLDDLTNVDILINNSSSVKIKLTFIIEIYVTQGSPFNQGYLEMLIKKNNSETIDNGINVTVPVTKGEKYIEVAVTGDDNRFFIAPGEPLTTYVLAMTKVGNQADHAYYATLKVKAEEVSQST